MTPEAQRAFDMLKRDAESQARLNAEGDQRIHEQEAALAEWQRTRPNLRTDVQVGMIVEDCSLHIGEVVFCDPYEGTVKIKSNFDGNTRSCSLYHCGVVVQTPEDVTLKTNLFNNGGMKALIEYYEKCVDSR